MNDDSDVQGFARTFQRFLEKMAFAATAAEGESELLRRIRQHLGAEPVGMPVVVERFPSYDHANVQVALDAYLAADGRNAELVGVAGEQRRFRTLAETVEMSRHGHHGLIDVGSVDYASVPVSIDTTLNCVQFGAYLLDDRGTPLVLLMRGPDPQHGHAGVALEVLTADAAAARALLTELRALMVTHNVFRGQVLSFEPHEFGEGVGPMRFHRRPDLTRTDVVLPDELLNIVERQVLGIAEHRESLRAAGQHLKRGLLLYGPPGTGKTLTVRYLLSRLPGFTVVVLSGLGVGYIKTACALARMLQPAMVVLEDCDLVAEERAPHGGANPLLFEVLNEIDGMAEDADVAFVLTTNRVDLLEPALAQRPGRVDQAVEIAPPDAAARRRLFELYSQRLHLDVTVVDDVVERTAGVTASYMKELLRRAALKAAMERPAPDRVPLRVTDANLLAALQEMSGSRPERPPDG